MTAKRGSAILVALGVGFVLLIVIATLRNFSSYRIQTTIQESRNVKALGIAEAGVAFAMTELSQSFDFQTHKSKSDLTWEGAETNTPTLEAKSGFNFNVTSSGRGTYCGTLADGEFRVRCGPITYGDDPKRSTNIDKSKAYIHIQSMGKVGETIKCVDVIVQRRFPGREFLLYDGEYLSIVYGEPGETNVNKFSTGHLYGHKGIEIGKIMRDKHQTCAEGSNQELFNMNSIISGDGGIFLYNTIKANFRARPGQPELTEDLPRTIEFPLSGTYSSSDAEVHGEMPKEIAGQVPKFPEDLQKKLEGRVLDKDAKVSIIIKRIPFDDHRKDAQDGGTYFSEAECNEEYRVPDGWPDSSGNVVKVKKIDFGNEIHQGNFTLPAGFKGVIFAEGNLVIKGNPPKDLKIVSNKNVFMAGDFNQAGNPGATGAGQNPERYGLPQNYAENAMKSEDYIPDIKNKLLNDANVTGTGFRYHKAVSVIGKERVVYDYRSPVDCFENELYPFMKYKIASFLKDETNARNSILMVSGNGGIVASATNGTDVRNSIASYFQEFPLLDTSAEDDIKQKFEDARNNSGSNFFDDTAFDGLCKETWKSYSSLYHGKRMENEGSSEKGKFGVYKLLEKLRGELIDSSGAAKQDKHDDFLFFPEMTQNAMCISAGKRNNVFYSGPDYSKRFDEIGRSETCFSAQVGLKHSKMTEMVHRLYGSEIRLAIFPNKPITGPTYNPPTRRKIYDETLPRLGGDYGNSDLAAFLILTWKDTRVTAKEFQEF